MIDTHCHLQFNAYKDDAEAVLSRCRAKGVILNIVGSQKDTSERAVQYAEKYDDCFATVGLHPVHLHSTVVDEEEGGFQTREEKFDYDLYRKLAKHPKTIAIGECGLELFHLPKGSEKKEILKKQEETFIAQYQLARELDLPLVIHIRDAYDEMIELLQRVIPRSEGRATLGSPDRSANLANKNSFENKGIATSADSHRLPRNDAGIRGVIHCYSSNWANAAKFLDLGFYIGFTGIITFPPKKTDPKAQAELLETVKKCPLDRILIETDAPYLAPQAYRGKRCEPWMVEEVAKKIAELRGISFEDVVKISSNNARRLFSKMLI